MYPRGHREGGKGQTEGAWWGPRDSSSGLIWGGEMKSFWCDSNRHRTRLGEAAGKPPGLNVQVHGGPGSPGQPELPGSTIPSLWLQNPWQDGQCLGRGDMLVNWGGLTTLGRWKGSGQGTGQLSELKIQGNGCSPPWGWPQLRRIPPGAADPLHTLATSRPGTHLHAEIQDEVSRASSKDLPSLLLPSGRVCPPVDSHVLSVSGGPLLHRVVRPVPALHGCDRRAEEDTHHHGAKLDDHRRATPHFRGKLSGRLCSPGAWKEYRTVELPFFGGLGTGSGKWTFPATMHLNVLVCLLERESWMWCFGIWALWRIREWALLISLKKRNTRKSFP